ncbi:hypothetical protein PV08_03639 [Exophiala spinifera]|uniref:Heterokaryon incompatibility domain-containing protein n=1 Tax=Exophiala spinifera TaxID=91928 RepID=A0A0D2C6Z0_9EURO|nr:uncharacterized protein PV08_03639 [Exophiala spinifera]KIW19344.1 hypothetical protein PV08_03639 [Exophiala spinifera]
MDDRGFILDSDASPQDVYSTLQSTEIRTLLIEPGSRGSPIVCELQVIPSPQSSQYEALSYVWGDTTRSTSISCNGFEFPVTESLHSALLHLRYADSWRRLWVDQLGINQASHEEVMKQVCLMGTIYSSASRVIVWLGRHDRKMTRAWNVLQETTVSSSLVRSDFLSPSSQTATPQRPSGSRRSSSNSASSVSKYSKRASSSRESLASSTSSLNSLTPKRPTNRRHETPPGLRSVLSIFQHVWFHRKWTFQEIILAKAAIICSGDLEMAWSDLTLWYFHYASKLRSTSILYDSQGFFESIMDVRSELGKGNLRLSNLLMVTRPRLSTKPEDAVYALLGLMPGLVCSLDIRRSTSRDDMDRHHHDHIYELYLAAMRDCLEKENDLAILSAAGVYKGNTHPSGWPSWLPDWRQQLPLRPLILTEQHDLGPEAAFDEETFGDATPKDPSQESPVYEFTLRRRHDNPASVLHQHLAVRGIRLGCVVTRTASWPSTFFVADPSALSSLGKTIDQAGEGEFARPLSSLATQTRGSLFQKFSSDTAQTYSHRLISRSLNSDPRCQPIRTSSMAEAGDWVCALNGGRVLYILRPLSEPDPPDWRQPQRSGRLSNVLRNSTPMTPSPKDAEGSYHRCIFIGECSIHGLRPADILGPEPALMSFELA